MEHTPTQNASFDALLEKSLAALRSIQVRPANESDLDFLVSEAEAFSKFYGSKHDLFPGPHEARVGLGNMVTNHVVFVSETKRVRTGFMAGYFVPHPFNPNINLLAESFWWVTPEYRMGRSGLLLLNAFVEFGRKHADWVTCSVEHHSPINEKCLLKRGFKLHEKSYLLEVE